MYAILAESAAEARQLVEQVGVSLHRSPAADWDDNPIGCGCMWGSVIGCA